MRSDSGDQSRPAQISAAWTPRKVYEDGAVHGEYYADLFVADKLVVELKARQTLFNEHTAQVLSYLRASHMEHGLLINFGAPRLEIRKFKL